MAAGNQAVLLLISGFILFRYVQALKVASIEMSSGKSRMLERLLLGLFLVWLFPLVSNTRVSIETIALRQMPLTLKDLFIVRAASLFIPPFSWLVLVSSFAIVIPITQAPRPVEGIVAAMMFLLLAWLTGLTASHLVAIGAWRKSIALLVVALLVVVATIVVYGRVDLFQRFLNIPATLVASPALGEKTLSSLALLGLLLVIAAVASAWSFRMSLGAIETSPQQRATAFSIIRGKTGSLSGKDLRYFHRLLDPYLGFIASGLGCFYLVFAEHPGVEVFWIFIIFIMFTNVGLAFNSFGLETRSGLDRYVLFPLTGRDVLVSKNVSILVFISMQVAPVILAAAFRLGVGQALLGCVEAIVLMLAYLTWGNVVSVTHRFQMEFFRFSSSGGSPIDAFVGVVFGSLPGAIAMRLFSWRMWWAVALMLGVYVLMYFGSLVWSGRRFERVRL